MDVPDVPYKDRLVGKVALITGAGSGLGYDCAKAFIGEGARVMIADLDVEAAQAAVSSLGENAAWIHCDVSDPSQVEAAVQATESTFGALHIMFNNAGTTGEFVPVADQDIDDFKKTFEVNVYSVFYGIKYAAPAIARAGGGAILNNSSISALHGAPSGGCYCATKSSVVQLTRSSSLELRDKNIRVNALLPGFTRSGMALADADDYETRSGNNMDALVKRRSGRWGEAVEVARVAVHLVSDESSFTTGASYVIDGGASVTLF